MSRLIWSPAALLDVKRLYDFLKPKDLDAAKRAVKAIRQGVKVLDKQSGVGRPVEDMEDEFRDWIIDFGDSGYVVRYRVDQRLVLETSTGAVCQRANPASSGHAAGSCDDSCAAFSRCTGAGVAGAGNWAGQGKVRIGKDGTGDLLQDLKQKCLGNHEPVHVPR
jgi:plasmid stabilization system protein ParE